ncbi:hypothetical protein [Saccharopolyspora sp. ASAGF58]|nr:hypothetical protein [Saccharopolyspora sp. ASAGF58]
MSADAAQWIADTAARRAPNAIQRKQLQGRHDRFADRSPTAVVAGR